MNEVRLDFSELSEPAKEEIYLAFMMTMMRHMKKPEVQDRFREWQRLREEANAASVPAMA